MRACHSGLGEFLIDSTNSVFKTIYGRGLAAIDMVESEIYYPPGRKRETVRRDNDQEVPE